MWGLARALALLNMACRIYGSLLESLECSFDSGLCEFLQDKTDNTDWTFKSGKTNTFDTGPDCDPQNCTGGQYLYLESSLPSIPGDKTRLKTPVIGGQGHRCLSFFYHMYGTDMGTLEVKLTSALSGHEQIIWAASGDHGNQWQTKQIDFISQEAYEIWIEGTVGPGYRSDMAIDSVSISIGRCTASMRFDCNFDHDVCGWTNASLPNDTLDWVRLSGETDTPLTGPTSDRLNPDGHYLYVESSFSTWTDKARLVSPSLSGFQTYCLCFWYHMYGDRIGNLSVLLKPLVGREQILWSIHGNQGNHWLSQQVNVTGSSILGYNIIFEATMNGFRGDVAIDDVSLQNTHCGR